MKVATTIQISREEDQEISTLREELGLSSKKAVVMEAIHNLRQIIEEARRKKNLQQASLKVRAESREQNRLWAKHSTATKVI